MCPNCAQINIFLIEGSMIVTDHDFSRNYVATGYVKIWNAFLMAHQIANCKGKKEKRTERSIT